MEKEKKGILLETGTNEIEVLEFTIDRHSYGINALKIRELIQFKGMNITPIVGTDKSILGTVIFRGQCVSLVDLARHLGIETNPDQTNFLTVIFTEFNRHTIGFLVDTIVGIRRISWSDIQPPNPLVNKSPITGIAGFQKHEVAMLDFETITQNVGIGLPVSTIASKTNFQSEEEKRARRGQIRLIGCDDAPIIRKSIKWTLEQANYKNITVFENGQQAYDEFRKAKSKAQSENAPITKYLHCIISDIEMPAMDGLTLCKKVKEEAPEIAVIIVSSMVNEQMAARCEKVNANGYLSKSDLNKLIDMVDLYSLPK